MKFTLLSLLALFSFFIISPSVVVAASTTDILVKASTDAVYYYAVNGKRYVFPSQKVYATWFNNFSNILEVSDSELAAMPIGGNITYRPGIKMLKIKTDPKVYAVDAGGALRWVTTEEIAEGLYGSNWNNKIDDVTDVYFTNYTVGNPITSLTDFSPQTAMKNVTTINANINLVVKSSTRVADTGLSLSPLAKAGEDQFTASGEFITFNAQESDDPDGEIRIYEWNFGDGAIVKGLVVTHAYSDQGIYDVLLTVTDNQGLTSFDGLKVTIGINKEAESLPLIIVLMDNFENDDLSARWIESHANTWKRKTVEKFEGAFAIEVDGPTNAEVYLTSADIDLQGRQQADISFAWRIKGSLDFNEYIAFDVSLDGGAVWEEKAILSGLIDEENRWFTQNIELINIGSFQIRFRARMSGASEDAYIDSVQVIAN